MDFDLILKNGTIITLDPDNPEYRWIGVKDGKIAAAGTRDDFAGNARSVIDLKGNTVVPGFADVHVHGFMTGQNLAAVDLRNVTCIDEVLHLLAERAKQVPPGGLVHGIGLKSEAIKEKRMPNRHELDTVCPDHLCAVYHTSVHGLSVNTLTLNRIGVLDHPELMGDYADEIKEGILLQDQTGTMAFNELFGKADEETVKGYAKKCCEYAASKGCTTIHALNGTDIESRGPIWEKVKDELCIHSLNMWETWDVQAAKNIGLPRVGGCLLLDGARALFQAAYSKPFLNHPDTRGLLYRSDFDVYNFVYEAHKNNMQIGMHAMGDRAIDQLIYIIDSVTKQLGDKGLRHRIEHFSYPTQRHIEMAAELQLALPMQPIWCEIWDDPANSVFAPMLGEDVAAENEPFRKLVEAGCMVGSSSDSPVTPIDPIKNLHILVNNPREVRRVSVTDALKISTYNGAWIGHEEKERGNLVLGKYADMVVIDRNPYVSPELIKDTNVLLTISEGRIAYQNPDFPI